MIPPKYRFFIGLSQTPVYKLNTALDSNGIEYESQNRKCTGFIALVSSYSNIKRNKYLFIKNNLKPLARRYLYFYDINKAVIKLPAIRPDKSLGIMLIPEEAMYIRLTMDLTDNLESNSIFVLNSAKPHYNKLTKKYSKESNQQFFRETLEGKLTLFGEDFDAIKSYSIQDELIFFMQKLKADMPNEWYTYFIGKFNKTDCKIDYSLHSCQLKLSALDRYTDIMNGYDNKYNILKNKIELTSINLRKRGLIQVYCEGSRTVSCFTPGGTYWEMETSSPSSDSNYLINTCHFALNKWIGVAGVGVPVVGEPGTISIPSAYEDILGYDYLCVQSSKPANWNTIDLSYTNGKYTIKTKWVERGDSLKYWVMEGTVTRNSDGAVLFTAKDGNNVNRQRWFYTAGNDELVKMSISGRGVSGSSASNVWSESVYARILCAVDKVDNLNTYNISDDDLVEQNRNYRKVIGFVTSSAIIVGHSFSDEPNIYGKTTTGEYYYPPYDYGSNKYWPLNKANWGDAYSLWYKYDSFIESMITKKFELEYTMKDAYSIGSIIKSLLSEIAPAVIFEESEEYSQFLYGSYNPVGHNFMRFFCTQKTNILKGVYDKPAQKVDTSLKEIMDMLSDCFRCYWHIDDDNKLHIEHISYYILGGSYTGSSQNKIYDLTALKDQFNGKAYSFMQNAVEFDKSSLSDRYEFNWADEATEPFIGSAIDINDKYVNTDKKEEISPTNFSSDIDHMIANPNNFSNDGFALLVASKKSDGTYFLPDVKLNFKDKNDYAYYEVILQNGFASWPFIVSHYYMHDLPGRQLTYDILAEPLHVFSIKQCMQQEVSFPCTEDLEMNSRIKTNFGTGTIDDISIDINTRITTVTVNFEPS